MCYDVNRSKSLHACTADPSRVPPGPYKSLKVLKFHTFKYNDLKSP